MYFLKTLQVRAPCQGGVLYSFWYWWNVVWIFYEFFKHWKKKFKQFFLISRFMLFSTLIQKYWKVPLHLLVTWEVVFPNSRWGQWESISNISSIPLFWFCISNVGVVWGGGGCNVFLTFYAISNISRKKKIWEYKKIFFLRKTIISHLIS